MVDATSADVQVLRTDDASADVLRRLRELFDDAFEGEFDEHDWTHTVGGWHVIVLDGEEVLAHAAVIERALEVGGRWLRAGYVEAVATATAHQRRGYGSQAMRAAMVIIARHFDLGVLATGEHAFYERLGWQRWDGPSWVIRGDTRERTAEEDEGIMVWRVGASADLQLGQPIACLERSGDDW